MTYVYTTYMTAELVAKHEERDPLGDLGEKGRIICLKESGSLIC
jgi:hypothetical protein